MTYRRRVDSDQLDATRANDTRGESNAHVASARAVLRNWTNIISEILRVASRRELSAFTKATAAPVSQFYRFVKRSYLMI